MSSPTTAQDRAYLGSPFAVATSFAVNGLFFASVLSRMPSIRAYIGASLAQLSLALVCVGIGSILAMPFTGRLTERFGSALVCRVSGTLALGAWTAVAWMPSVFALGLCLLFAGLGLGVWDVAMNVQGVTVEQRRTRVLMPMLHALFSFGAVTGALMGAACAAADISTQVQFPVVGALMVTALFVCTKYFVSDAVPVEDRVTDVGSNADSSSVSARPGESRPGASRREIVLGIIVLATAMGEGAANDWLGLVLVDTRGVAEAFGALTLAGFNLTMGIGRVIGGKMIARMGRVPILRVSGGVASFGILLLCLVNSPVTALIGAGCWGLGLAVVFPSGVSAAGEIPGRGPRAIALVSTIGYTGFLLGAPLIGQLTRVWPLDRALLVVAVAVLLVVFLAPAAREDKSLPSRP
ncbi:MFS transporter [Nakamurella antarctica]|uniref:MFS transporter n=1 Tax=Nakamurella antarctica TaxID=1902245 RepID=A0A3G8ZI14_9ACTN|nr:MFS transporter [Nakamurella antarctica]AZI57032.1 MFS transporter [Nakamurella antarctica]